MTTGFMRIVIGALRGGSFGLLPAYANALSKESHDDL